MTQATEERAPSNNLRIVDLDKMEDLAPGEALEDHLTVEPQGEAEPNPQSEADTKPAIPKKFEGKTVEEIVEAYQNLEKKFGQQGTDLGELRRMTDKILLEQAANNASPSPEAEPEIDDEDFLVNPKETIEKLVERKVQKITEQLENKDREAAMRALEEKHPDMTELVQDEGFQEWVLASKAREANWTKAASGDLVQADELFSTYKELKQPKPTEATPAQDTAVDQEALQTATAMATGDGADAASGVKPIVYSRARLVQLQIENPQKYQALGPEITRAYQEGRVVD